MFCSPYKGAYCNVLGPLFGTFQSDYWSTKLASFMMSGSSELLSLLYNMLLSFTSFPLIVSWIPYVTYWFQVSHPVLNYLYITLWILAQKWYRHYRSLEKIYFALWIKTKLGKKEFLKSYIVLLTAELNCTNTASRKGWPAVLVRWQLKGTMYDFKNSFFLDFVYIQRAKHILLGKKNFEIVHCPFEMPPN